MYIKNEKLQCAYRLALILLCQIGIVLQYAIVFKIGKVGMLSCYYTMHSNFVVLAYFLYLLICQPKKENAMVKSSLVICIMITNLGYHFLLNGAMEAGVGAVGEVSSMDVWANNLVHYVVPLMTLADYLLFTPKGESKWWHPFCAAILPALYVVFALVRAEVSEGMFAGFSGFSRYPYPFIDVDLLGFGRVILICLVMLMATVLMAYLLMGVDRILAKLPALIGAKRKSERKTAKE